METQRHEFVDGGGQTTTPTDHDENGSVKTLTSPDHSEATWIVDIPRQDEEVIEELAKEEFEWDEGNSEEDQLAIPIRTGTGRVYKSFEEMLSDSSYPMTPFAETWREKASTAEEITQAFKAVE